jgi:hypothetical protein
MRNVPAASWSLSSICAAVSAEKVFRVSPVAGFIEAIGMMRIIILLCFLRLFVAVSFMSWKNAGDA